MTTITSRTYRAGHGPIWIEGHDRKRRLVAVDGNELLIADALDAPARIYPLAPDYAHAFANGIISVQVSTGPMPIGANGETLASLMLRTA